MNTPRAIRVTIDQISEGADGLLASLVTDSGQTLVVPVEVLPSGASEGDVLELRLRLDPDETRTRRERIAKLQRELFGA